MRTTDPLDVMRDALLAAGCDPRGGQRITAKCPAHDDSNPSLSVARGTEQPVVLTCHAGCDPDDVLAALRLNWSDLAENDDYEPRPEPKRIVAVYPYTDEAGKHLFDVVRFEPKDFRQRHADGRWGLNGARRVPYRLPALIEAVAAGETVYVVEGEKDVHAVVMTGAVATCNPGGAGKWRADWSEYFTGAQVVVIADDDGPGHQHAQDVARHLAGAAKHVAIMLPAVGAKDPAEHLGMGRTLDELRPFQHLRVVDDTEGWEPPSKLGYPKVLPVFPAHRFPPYLNDYCVAVAHTLQTPVDLPCMLVLSVLAAIAGGRCVAEVRAGWREPLNLFTATAMSPGERKTPVFMRLIRPLETCEAKAMDDIRGEVADARARQVRARALADKAEAEAGRASEDASAEAVHYAAQARLMAEAITVPAIPRILADDATPESLASLMAEQGGRLALFSDEGEVFNMMAGRYSASGPNLGVYLKAHVGSPIRVDRKGRDPEVIPRPALTLGLTIQPEMLAAISSIQGARGRGLLGRILWSVPVGRVGGRDVWVGPVAEELDDRYLDEMAVLFDSLKEWEDPAVLVFSADADLAVRRFEERMEARLDADRDGDLVHIADWGSKLVGHTVRIAALLHLASNVRTGWAQPVSAATVADAIAIADYLALHAIAAFDAMSVDPVVADGRAVLNWITRRRSFSRREVFHAYQYRFGKVTNLDPVLDLLVEHGYIRPIRPESTTRRGRPASVRFAVNPLIGDGS